MKYLVLCQLLTWTQKPTWEKIAGLNEEVKYYWHVWNDWTVDKDGLYIMMQILGGIYQVKIVKCYMISLQLDNWRKLVHLLHTSCTAGKPMEHIQGMRK